MTTYVKPCPVCGHAHSHYRRFNLDGRKYGRYCDKCNWGVGGFDCQEDALDYWNTRYPRICEWKLREGLWHTTCGHRQNRIDKPVLDPFCPYCGGEVFGDG